MVANRISCHSLVLGKMPSVCPLAWEHSAVSWAVKCITHNCKSFLRGSKIVLIHPNGFITLDRVDFWTKRVGGHRGMGKKVLLILSKKPLGTWCCFIFTPLLHNYVYLLVKFCIHLCLVIARLIIALHFVLLITAVLLTVRSKNLSSCAGSWCGRRYADLSRVINRGSISIAL